MRKVFIFTLVNFLMTFAAYSQDVEDEQSYIDSIENSLKYERGAIELENGVAKLNIPAGYKFLNAEQAQYVLTDLWGNPEDESVLGLILPENQSILDDNGYAFEIYYSEIGYVKDNDADKIDYDDLLKDLKAETTESNKEREKLGYTPVTLIGWASKPYYDKDKKVLHWAKEAKFGENEVNTLNYNIRFLGRHGVLVVNAIAAMPQLPVVKEDIPKILDIVQFNDGYKYKDFDPSIDDVAKWTIGGLVAGKILTKVGFVALLAKFWKIIALAIAGFFGVFWKKIRRKKNDDVEQSDIKQEENTKDFEK